MVCPRGLVRIDGLHGLAPDGALSGDHRVLRPVRLRGFVAAIRFQIVDPNGPARNVVAVNDEPIRFAFQRQAGGCRGHRQTPRCEATEEKMEDRKGFHHGTLPQSPPERTMEK